jgi:hypothetical protein
MSKLMIAAVLCMFAGSAVAQDATCAVQAGDKKLAGAAKTSFVKKCCDTQAADKKLAGAAKNSFTEKCLKDAGV